MNKTDLKSSFMSIHWILCSLVRIFIHRWRCMSLKIFWGRVLSICIPNIFVTWINIIIKIFSYKIRRPRPRKKNECHFAVKKSVLSLMTFIHDTKQYMTEKLCIFHLKSPFQVFSFNICKPKSLSMTTNRQYSVFYN